MSFVESIKGIISSLAAYAESFLNAIPAPYDFFVKILFFTILFVKINVVNT